MTAESRRIDDYFPRELLTRFGGTLTEAGAAANDAVERFISLLGQLPAEVIGQPIAPGKWTPLGFTDHLLRVTNIWSDDIAKVMGGGSTERHPRGLVDANGKLLVTVPGAEPGSARPAAELVSDLRKATARLIEHVTSAEASGFATAVVHVNPYFGELTPIGCLQLAATHAHHHRKRHLLGLLSR